MKNEESDNVIITTDIKNDFEKNECYDIGTRKRLWIRNCPNCSKEICYKSYKDIWYGMKYNILCRDCKESKKYLGELECYDIVTKKRLFSRKCPECKKVLFYRRKDVRDISTKNNRICCSCVGFTRPRIFGRKNTEIAKKKMSESKKGKYCGSKNHMFGKHWSHTEETKRKIRLSTIKRISNNRCNGYQIKPSFNISACKFIEEYGKKNGYCFRHAMNGGEFYIKELGYWVDGYDREKNVVIEYDESRHFDIYGNIKKKDIGRMNEIKNYLKCKFVRYNEKTNELNEF